jgi:hypothetical protein
MRCLLAALSILQALSPSASCLLAQQSSSGPAPRQHHAITYDPVRRQVLIHGGLSRDSVGPRDTPPLDDVWGWNGQRWSPLVPSSGLALVGHQFYADRRGDWFVTGGAPHAITARWSNDAWVTVSNDSSRRRDLAAGAYDPDRNRFVLFGGRIDRSTRSSETWEFDGLQWTRFDVPSPPARLGAMMSYDSRHRVMVLFGGRDGATLHGDTWTWDGREWRQVASTGPAPRISAGMTFDATRGRVVLFGGLGEAGYLGDTWTWDGRAWEQADVAGPSPRVDGLLAFDAARAVVLLFGGTPASLGTLGDTWEWDGSRWRERTPGAARSP